MLSFGDRLGFADPSVGSLQGFLRRAYLIFYYGTTLIETIHTGVPATGICQQTGLIEAFLRTLQAIVDEGLQRFGHMRIPCSRSWLADKTYHT